MANFLVDQSEISTHIYTKIKFRLNNSNKFIDGINNKKIKQSDKLISEKIYLNVDPNIFNLYPNENFSMSTVLRVNLTVEFTESNLNDSIEINDLSFGNLLLFPNVKKMIFFFMKQNQNNSVIKIYCESIVSVKGLTNKCIHYSFQDRCLSDIFPKWKQNSQNDLFIGYCKKKTKL